MLFIFKLPDYHSSLLLYLLSYDIRYFTKQVWWTPMTSYAKGMTIFPLESWNGILVQELLRKSILLLWGQIRDLVGVRRCCCNISNCSKSRRGRIMYWMHEKTGGSPGTVCTPSTPLASSPRFVRGKSRLFYWSTSWNPESTFHNQYLVFGLVNRNGPWLTAFIRRDTVGCDPMAGRQH